MTTDLLKFATMMGMGRVMQSTPQMAHSEATSLPGEDNGLRAAQCRAHTSRCLGGDVTIAGAGHGDDGPVQGLGQRVERRVLLVLLQGVAQASEDQHPHADCHAQKQQLPATK